MMQNSYINYADCALALYEGKIDFYVNNTIQFPFVAAEYPGFSYISRTMTRFDNGAVFPKNKAGEALCRRFNSFLAKAKEDGTLEELNEYWLKPGDWKNPDIPKEGKNGTLKMVTCTTMKPFSFLLNNEYAGFDIALAAEFCRQNGYALEIDNADFAGVLGGISTGRYDLAAGQIAWTKERAENVLYSDLYVSQLIVPYVRTADFSEASDRNTESPTFFEKIATSFRRTFIDENRWQIILNGLAATLIISVFGFLLANVLGALFCFLSLSKRKAFRIAADVYSRIMQGTPIVAVLMILYYIVFGNTDLSGIIIAVIGFGITSGAYVAQVFSGGISSISSGQREAALALGMTKRRAFTGIVLPQAIRRMLPGYFSQFISLVKGTAIVGYIAVIDLTKAGDIIRSTTFEVFFPLLTTAVIYFLISFLLLSVMKRIEKYLAPKRRSSKGKGA